MEKKEIEKNVRDLSIIFPSGRKYLQPFSPEGYLLLKYNLADTFSKMSKRKTLPKEKSDEVVRLVENYHNEIKPVWKKFLKRIFLPKLLLNLALFSVIFAALFLMLNSGSIVLVVLACSFVAIFFLSSSPEGILRTVHKYVVYNVPVFKTSK